MLADLCTVYEPLIIFLLADLIHEFWGIHDYIYLSLESIFCVSLNVKCKFF